ncbi:hypothetical protein SGRIM128S_06896 [Streptomyces griseomycini]
MHDSDTDRGSGGSRGSAAAPAPARRSDSTRAAILHAARERFASDGYERATIRAIARDAKIDPSMVMRYYGNKEGLFAAAVAIDLELPDLGALPRQEVGRALARHFLAVWEGNEVLTALLRVAATSRAGAERTQGVFRDQILPVVRQVCPDPEQVPARAALVTSQTAGTGAHPVRPALPPGGRADPGGDRGVAGADAAAVSDGAASGPSGASELIGASWPAGPAGRQGTPDGTEGAVPAVAVRRVRTAAGTAPSGRCAWARGPRIRPWRRPWSGCWSWSGPSSCATCRRPSPDRR